MLFTLEPPARVRLQLIPVEGRKFPMPGVRHSSERFPLCSFLYPSLPQSGFWGFCFCFFCPSFAQFLLNLRFVWFFQAWFEKRMYFSEKVAIPDTQCHLSVTCSLSSQPGSPSAHVSCFGWQTVPQFGGACSLPSVWRLCSSSGSVSW